VPRKILIGTPLSLYKFTAADIPPGGDLSNSFFQYVDFHPRTGGVVRERFNGDLSAVNLTDVDMLNCDCRNVLTGDISYIMSRRTNWTGATISPTLKSGFGSADLIREILRQNGSTYALAALSGITPFVYPLSWKTMSLHMFQVEGSYPISHQKVLALFANYPHILRRLNEFGADRGMELDRSDQYRLGNLAEIHVAGGLRPYNISQHRSVQTLGLDRYDLARRVETAMEQFGRFEVRVTQIDPSLILSVSTREVAVSDPDWWKRKIFRCD